MSEIVLSKQKEFFLSGKTLSYSFRKEALVKLQYAILRNKDDLEKALKIDLGKSAYEAYLTEIGFALDEIKYALKHLRRWVKPKLVRTPITNFLAKSYIIPDPYGNTLIISPWNYPFLLAISPLIGSIAGGNTTIIKPSEYAPTVSKVLEKMINQTFDENYIKVITGNHQVASGLLDLNFDFIFFTGSPRIGKIVLQKASINLTPVCLELGGKSPCLVLDDASLDITSRRIIFGKLLNSGQTCVAPDYIYVDKKIKDKLIPYLIKYIKEFYGDNPLIQNDYGKIIDKVHYDRLMKLVKDGHIIVGGFGDGEKILPTLIDQVTFKSPIMQEEIFGPILPIITFDSLDEALSVLQKQPHPLAFYLFTSSIKNKKIMEKLPFGGGAINDTIMHLVNPYLPFGGSGNSGMGRYHGHESFLTFTKKKSILDKSTLIDIKLRYAPYTDKKDKLLKRIYK